jgi:hypothetical protein
MCTAQNASFSGDFSMNKSFRPHTVPQTARKATMPLRVLTAPLAAAAMTVIIHSANTSQAAPAAKPTATPAAKTPALTPQQKQRAQEVTAMLNKFLRKRITSPGGKLQLTVRPAPRADLGYFSEVYIAARPAKVKKLMISDFAMRARNVKLSVAALMNTEDREILTTHSQTTLRAVVTEQNLQSMLARGRHTANMGLKVNFLRDRIYIAGNANWGMLKGPVAGTGKLRLGADRKVYFDILSMKMNGIEAPQMIKNNFSSRINPLIDTDDLPFQPRFKSIQFVGDSAILTAG